MEHDKNKVVGGTTGPGKTTDVESLRTFQPSREISITDIGEIRLTAAEVSRIVASRG